MADRVLVTVCVRRLRSTRCSQAAPPAPAQEAKRLVLEPGLSLSWVGMEGAGGKAVRFGSAQGNRGFPPPSSQPQKGLLQLSRSGRGLMRVVSPMSLPRWAVGLLRFLQIF